VPLLEHGATIIPRAILEHQARPGIGMAAVETDQFREGRPNGRQHGAVILGLGFEVVLLGYRR